MNRTPVIFAATEHAELIFFERAVKRRSKQPAGAVNEARGQDDDLEFRLPVLPQQVAAQLRGVRNKISDEITTVLC